MIYHFNSNLTCSNYYMFICKILYIVFKILVLVLKMRVSFIICFIDLIFAVVVFFLLLFNYLVSLYPLFSLHYFIVLITRVSASSFHSIVLIEAPDQNMICSIQQSLCLQVYKYPLMPETDYDHLHHSQKPRSQVNFQN